MLVVVVVVVASAGTGAGSVLLGVIATVAVASTAARPIASVLSALDGRS